MVNKMPRTWGTYLEIMWKCLKCFPSSKQTRSFGRGDQGHRGARDTNLYACVSPELKCQYSCWILDGVRIGEQIQKFAIDWCVLGDHHIASLTGRPNHLISVGMMAKHGKCVCLHWSESIEYILAANSRGSGAAALTDWLTGCVCVTNWVIRGTVPCSVGDSEPVHYHHLLSHRP